MSDAEEIVEEYPHSCRIIREKIEAEEDRFHYEGPLGRMQSFYSEEQARLYADVSTVTGGFREEKTGERGVPPAVARSREDVLIAYLAAQPTMGVKWAARSFEIDEDEVRAYIDIVRDRAEQQREEDDDE